MSDKDKARIIVEKHLSDNIEFLKMDSSDIFGFNSSLISQYFDCEANKEKDTMTHKPKKLTSEELKQLLSEAKIDNEKWLICNKIIESDLSSSKLKFELQRDLPKQPRARGVDPNRDRLRNRAIALATYKVEKLGITYCSNGNNSNRETACSIVSKALESFSIYRTPDAIRKSRDKYPKQ